MLSPPTSPGRLPVRLVALGVLILALGVVMQALGIVLPAFVAEVTGAATAFGAMARIGGAICILGLVGAAFGARTADAAAAPEPAEPSGRPADDLVPAITDARTAEWQRRLAEKAAAPGPLAEPMRSRRVAASLHRAAIVLVAVALGGMLAAAMWGSESSPVTSAAHASPGEPGAG